jgi:hypothetical protein
MNDLFRIKRSGWSPRLSLDRALGSDARERPGNLTDRWLPRIAHLSQLGLLLLAVIGYFYTVVPIYQKSVLEEQIAQKQVELKQTQVELDKKQGELKKAASDLEKSYEVVRRFEVGQFVFHTGAECSGLFRHRGEVEPLNVKRSEPRISPVEDVLKLPVTECLQENLAKQLKKDLLRPADRDELRNQVERIIPAVVAKRAEVMKRFEILKPQLEVAREARRKRLAAVPTEALLGRGAGLLDFLEEERQIHRRELDLAGEYTNFIRSQVAGIRNAFAGRPQR